MVPYSHIHNASYVYCSIFNNHAAVYVCAHVNTHLYYNGNVIDVDIEVVIQQNRGMSVPTTHKYS